METIQKRNAIRKGEIFIRALNLQDRHAATPPSSEKRLPLRLVFAFNRVRRGGNQDVIRAVQQIEDALEIRNKAIRSK